ncbi:hypothetical protein ACHAO1_011116 [Botrytis cinerea]
MPDTEQTEQTLSKDDEGPYIEQTNNKKSTKAKSHTLESDLLAKHIRIWHSYLHDNCTGMNTGQKILFLKRKAEANLEQLMEDRGPLYSLKGEEFYESIYSSQDIDLYERIEHQRLIIIEITGLTDQVKKGKFIGEGQYKMDNCLSYGGNLGGIDGREFEGRLSIKNWMMATRRAGGYWFQPGDRREMEVLRIFSNKEWRRRPWKAYMAVKRALNGIIERSKKKIKTVEEMRREIIAGLQ